MNFRLTSWEGVGSDRLGDRANHLRSVLLPVGGVA